MSVLPRTLVLTTVLVAQPVLAQDADGWRTIEIETTEVTAPDVAITPDGETLIFTLLGHLFRLPVEGGEAEQLTFGPYYDAKPAAPAPAEVELGFELRLVGRLGAAGRYTYQRIDRRLSGGGTSVTSRIEQDTARIGVTYRLRGED